MKIKHLLLGLIGFFWLLLGIIFFSYNSEHQFNLATKNIQQKTNQVEDYINKVLINKTLLDKLISRNYTLTDLDHLQDAPVDLFIYQNNDLIFWSSHIPFVSYKLNEIDTIVKLRELKNGFYLTKKINYGAYTLLFTHLVKSNYQLNNQFLTNTFNKYYNLNVGFEISIDEDLNEAKNIKSKNGDILYYTSFNNFSIVNTPWQLVSGLLFILGILIFSVVIIFKYIAEKKFHFALISLIAGFALSKATLFYLPEYASFSQLFNPALYASLFFGDSISKIFINSWWLLCLSFIYFVWFKRKAFKNQALKLFIWTLSVLILFILYSQGIKSLILDSTISFNINSIAEFNNYTFIGLLIITFFAGSFFLTLISYQKILLSKTLKFLTTGVSFSLVVIYLYTNNWSWLAVVLPLSILIFLFIIQFLENFKSIPSKSAKYLIAIFWAALVSSLIIYHFNAKKVEIKKIQLASQLINQKDLMAEFNFLSIIPNLKEDPFVQKYFTSPLFSNKDLFQRINQLYFNDYFNKYNLELKSYNSEGRVMKSPTFSSIDMYPDLLNKIDTLVFNEKNDGSLEYQSILSISQNERILGYLHFRFTPKKFTIENVYPELLMEKKNKPKLSLEDENFDYALYIRGFLNSQFGNYPYPFEFSFAKKLDIDYNIETKNGYKHFIYSDNQHRIVVISSKLKGLLSALSIFSYLIIFFFISSLLLLPIFQIIQQKATATKIKKFISSFRFRISISIVLIILISFALIGFFTISYFSKEYEEFYEDDLIKKQNTIISSLDNLISENKQESFYELFSSTLQLDVKNLSDLHKIDINIYSRDGYLISSSQPSIFSSGLISYKMNPNAYFVLENAVNPRIVLREKIGSLFYLSSYIPIRNERREIVGFLNLPYFDTETDLKREISELLLSLINIYVLLLVKAILAGLFITNSITQPLSKIGEKLSSVNILAKNEPLQWKNNDEIGALIEQYNKMIEELQKGAEKLAKNEREGAWREMARQIAHEIKNPLTPMKLSIQHLQRTIKDNPDSAKDLTPRVAATLIEQIDNLSEIASAFSSFAKMPKPEREVISLIPIIDSVVELFNSEDITFIKTYKIDNIEIFADKNQMVSVFNNLIKNAIQATETKNDRNITIEIKKENKFVIISIKDNGIGIAKEMEHKIFTPNFTTKSSGTGLGLAISKQIIENSDGEIWFTSIENEETIFYIKMPYVI